MQRKRRLAERLTVDLDNGLAELLELFDELAFRLADLARGARGGLRQHVLERLLFVVRELRPHVAADDRHERFRDVARQHDVALHLVELLRHDRRQRVLLPVDGALLQREIDFGEGDRRRVGTHGLGEHEEQRCRRHAQLHALHVLGLLDLLVGRDVALPVVGERDHLVPRLVLVALGNVAEELALAIGLPVVEVAQHEGRVGDGDRLVNGPGEGGARVDDIDRAEAQALVDLVLVAELRGRENLDLVLAVRALLDFLGRPERLGVIGLGHLVDVRPFQLGLRGGGGCKGHSGDDERAGKAAQAADRDRH